MVAATEIESPGQLDERDDDQLLFDELGETRIQAQKRWQREGVAEQAAEFRMAQRKKGKATGLTRTAAGNAAWRKAIEEFPSPAMKCELAVRERFRRSDVIRDRGQSVPENVATALPGELAFADLWAAPHELFAEHFYWEDPPRDPDECEGRYTAQRASQHVANSLQMELPHDIREVGRSPAQKALMGWMIADLGGFLAYAETSITREIQRQEELAADDRDDAIDQPRRRLSGSAACVVVIRSEVSVHFPERDMACAGG